MTRQIQLSAQETKDAGIAFQQFSENKDAITIKKEEFQSAFEFFCDLYIDILESSKHEVQNTIIKTPQSSLNETFFISCIKKLKVLNLKLVKREFIQLNENFIIKNLQQKDIQHLDRCWGKFDCNQSGYIKVQDLREVVNSVLLKYNTKKITKEIREQDDIITVCSPIQTKKKRLSDSEIEQVNSINQNNMIEAMKQKEQANIKIFAELNDTQSNQQLQEWIKATEQNYKAVSFEYFTNFMADAIYNNNLRFKSSYNNCGCNIF